MHFIAFQASECSAYSMEGAQRSDHGSSPKRRMPTDYWQGATAQHQNAANVSTRPPRRRMVDSPAERACEATRLSGRTAVLLRYEDVVANMMYMHAANQHTIELSQPEKKLHQFLQEWQSFYMMPQGREYEHGRLYTYWSLIQTVKLKGTLIQPALEKFDTRGTTPWIRGIIKVAEETGDVVVMDKDGNVAFTAVMPGINNSIVDFEVFYPAKGGAAAKQLGAARGVNLTCAEYPSVKLTVSLFGDASQPSKEITDGAFIAMEPQEPNIQSQSESLVTQAQCSFYFPFPNGLIINFSGIPHTQAAIKAMSLMYSLKKSHCFYHHNKLPMPMGLLHMCTRKSLQPLTTPAVLQYLLSSINEVRVRGANKNLTDTWFDLLDYNERILLTYTYNNDFDDADTGEVRILDNFGTLLFTACSLKENKSMNVADHTGGQIGHIKGKKFFDEDGVEVMHLIESGQVELQESKSVGPIEERQVLFQAGETTQVDRQRYLLRRKYPNFEIHTSQEPKYRLATITAEEASTKIDIHAHIDAVNNWKVLILMISLKIAINSHKLDCLPLEFRPYKFLQR